MLHLIIRPQQCKWTSLQCSSSNNNHDISEKKQILSKVLFSFLQSNLLVTNLRRNGINFILQKYNLTVLRQDFKFLLIVKVHSISTASMTNTARLKRHILHWWLCIFLIRMTLLKSDIIMKSSCLCCLKYCGASNGTARSQLG